MRRHAVIGTYTDGDGNGIYTCPVATDGLPETDRVHSNPVPDDPSFVARHPTGDCWYAVHETDPGAASAIQVDADGNIEQQNRVKTGAEGPCFCRVHPSGDHLLVAHYTGSAVSVLPIGSDGTLANPTAVEEHEGSSITSRQTAPHPHSIVPGPNGKFVYVPDLGTDEIVVYEIDERGGTLQRKTTVDVRPGAGPRHLTFHPTEPLVFVSNELDSTVAVFEWVEQTGVFEHVDRVSTCPSDGEVENYPGEVLVHPDGKRLYASNRGHDSIVVFEIDPEGGSLEPRAWVDTEGEWPRHFSLDPAGETLFVGNRRSGSVTVFRVSSESGRPHRTEASIPVPNPTCVAFTRVEDE